MLDFGGVDPTCVHALWREKEPLETTREISWLVVEIEFDGLTANGAWMNEVFSHIKIEDRWLHFVNAFNNLKRLGLIYEVITVWSQDPLSEPKAELLYPLYIRDFHARQKEPYLLPDIHNFLVQSECWDGLSLVQTLEDVVGSNNFRLLRFESSTQHVMGVIRLRYRAATNDVGTWAKEEEQRVKRWQETLRAWSTSYREGD